MLSVVSKTKILNVSNGDIAVKITDAWKRRPLSFATSKITANPHINCIFASSYLPMLSYGASQGLKV